jgi:hypothetical protein
MASVPPSSRSEIRDSLLTMIKAQVWKYKSIEDSPPQLQQRQGQA